MPLSSPNPYAAGAGVAPPALTGREAEIDHCRELLTALEQRAFENSLLIAGVRGVGKTCLLNEFEKIAEEAEWQCEMYEVQNGSDVPAALARIFRKVLLELSTKEKVKDRALQALRVLKGFTASIGGVEFTLDVDAIAGKADSGAFREDLKDLLLEVGEVAAANGKGVLILIDEIQLVEGDHYEALIVALHRVVQKNLPIAFIGAGLPTSRSISAETKTYVERMFITPTLGPLDHDDARAALADPAKARGVRYEPEALDKILEYSDRYPFFLQKYGRQVWRLADASPITGEIVEAAQPIVQADLDQSFFAFRISTATPREVEYMAAMAALGDGPQSVSEIAAKAGYTSSTAASPHRDALLKKNLVWAPERGLLEFTAPLFADCLRRNHPIG